MHQSHLPDEVELESKHCEVSGLEIFLGPTEQAEFHLEWLAVIPGHGHRTMLSCRDGFVADVQLALDASDKMDCSALGVT